MGVTISESFVLPSKGKVYKEKIDPHVELRSMTVEDEMRRLSPSSRPYENMAKMIEGCLKNKLPIPVYNLCLGDYIYLLHKLRVVTYGPDYHIQFKCPLCGSVEHTVFDLDSEKILEYDDSIKDLYMVELPKTGHTVRLRLQTPKDLDDIVIKASEMKKDFPEMKTDLTLSLTLKSMIDTIDGNPVDQALILEQLKGLPMADANMISNSAVRLNGKVGVDSVISVHCEHCNNDVNITFPYTNEFYGPTTY